jgi:hypothetical protein
MASTTTAYARSPLDVGIADRLIAAMPAGYAIATRSVHPLAIPVGIAKAGIEYAIAEHHAAKRDRASARLSIERIQTVQEQLAADRQEQWRTLAGRQLAPAEMGEAAALLLEAQSAATLATLQSFRGSSG